MDAHTSDNNQNAFVGLDHENNSESNQENNQNQSNSIRGQPSKTSTKTNTMAGSNIKTTSKSSSSQSVSCRAYEVAEFYRQRKEYQLKKVKEDEERLRRHKAKPMPNFKAIHSKAVTAVKDTVDACVSPETPKVLRRGLAMKEKQKQKIKEHEIKLAERPPIVARPTTVLKEEPFKPKLEPHHELKVEPFNLKMSERLLERKKFDENYQRELATKKEKEQEQKRKEEQMTRQVVRERTTFKARPNPFKKPERTT